MKKDKCLTRRDLEDYVSDLAFKILISLIAIGLIIFILYAAHHVGKSDGCSSARMQKPEVRYYKCLDE